MVWIGLHGVMFLFLFSDFYKQAYSKRREAAAARKRQAEMDALASSGGQYDAVAVNGSAKSANGKLQNGHHLYQNGKELLLTNGDLVNNNQGACMVSRSANVEIEGRVLTNILSRNTVVYCVVLHIMDFGRVPSYQKI